MQFSIIIPSFNRVNLLPRTLATIWQQSVTDFEVIIVDDGSTDGTISYLQSLNARIRFLRQENNGPGAARNLGAAEASGEYLAFLDSDDLWFPWTLATFATLIRNHGRPAILSAQLVEFTREVDLAGIREEAVCVDTFVDYLASNRSGYFVGAGMSVIRRDAFIAASGFSTARINAEDHDLIMRMGIARGFIKVLRPATLAWRRHSSSVTGELELGVKGIRYLLEQEHLGNYPGGRAREQDRHEIITRHARPIAIRCLRDGALHDAWELFFATFVWHIRLWRWRFLVAFPVMAVFSLFKRSR